MRENSFKINGGERGKHVNFSSFSPDKFNIDPTTLHPVREGFDVVYDVSASDNVRTIAAYLSALFELGWLVNTNHPGLLILDEPRQQNLHWGDLATLLERLALADTQGRQVIVATPTWCRPPGTSAPA